MSQSFTANCMACFSYLNRTYPQIACPIESALVSVDRIYQGVKNTQQYSTSARMMVVYTMIRFLINGYQVSRQKVLQNFIELCGNLRDSELYKIQNSFKINNFKFEFKFKSKSSNFKFSNFKFNRIQILSFKFKQV